MKNINRYLVLIFISFHINLSAQISKDKHRYDYQVREEKGDLNNDGKADKITVKMDTIDETRPFHVQIFLSQPNGKLSLAAASDKMIEPQYPAENNGRHTAFQIPTFFIEKGILSMWSEIENGNITYDYRYLNGNFELVHVKKLTSNAPQGYTDENTVFTEMNFDLIKGVITETDATSGAKKPSSIRKRTKLARPLPKLQDFKYSDKDLY